MNLKDVRPMLANSATQLPKGDTSSGQTFSAGKPQVWSNKTVEDFDMAPDGKRYIVIHKETPVQQGPAQLTFLVNFFGELRRRVDAAQ